MSVQHDSSISCTEDNVTAPQSWSSEVVADDLIAAKPIIKPKAAHFRKKYCAAAIGLKGCIKIATDNAAYISDAALFKMAGKHSFVISWKQGRFFLNGKLKKRIND